ncbi:DUF3047 domain-containing protein [Ahrensia sp. R2A130]|uniref:DUF3047 domain-containing protein n=1 Tax=Ahrensia sp. R2A130 TaxID=744979 RepID=UPI0001E08C95|nr:DUF3047 domain-containing protein [Ahrensia sp. R2A130]EFL88111.1 conserved hypothetical protein [Ahrensia sp. R2A130]
MAAIPNVARANTISFNNGWEHLKFRSLKPNTFNTADNAVTVIAEGTSSILYRILPSDLFDSRSAEWTWRVDNSVPPSDLSDTDNDDRNLGVFFVNASDRVAGRIRPGTGISSLMRNRNVQVLMYTWGGNNPQGTVVPSPQASGRLRNIVQRRPAAGEFRESVDLASDFQRVFGVEMSNLVALAISSNSENSGSRVQAQVSEWVLG